MDDDGGGSPGHYGGGGIHLVCEYCGHGSEYAEDDADDGFFTCRQCSAIHTSTQNTATNPFDFPMTPAHLSAHRRPTQPTPTPKPFPAPRGAATGAAAPDFDDLGEPSEPRDFATGANAWGNPEDVAARVRWRYVRGLQVILQRQLEALVERHRVGSLAASLAGTIWLRWVAASKVFDEMWVHKMLAIAASVEEGHSASKDKQSELEGDAQKSQSSYEFLFLRSLRMMLPVYSTLAVCFLACHVARETILPTDICRWAMEGKLPYVAAFTQVDKLLGSSLNDCPLSSRQLFRPTRVIGAWQLEAAAGSIAQKIGLLLPSVNFYLIAQRFLKELSLPIEKILPHACRIYEWAMPAELWLSSNPGRVPSRVCVMAILIVALRVLYGINGQGIWESIAQTENAVGSDPEASAPHSIEPDSNNSEEFDARELLCTLAASYDKINVGHDYSKEVHSYLKYCKDVVFTGMTFSLEEEHLIDIFWDMYKGKEDENAKLCQEKLRTTNGVNKRCRDGRFADTKCCSTPLGNCALQSIKSKMEENGFCYVSPRKRLVSDGYLLYTRRESSGSLIYVAHADYYILLRPFAKLAEVDVRVLHSSVLKLERRLGWIEERVGRSLNTLQNLHDEASDDERPKAGTTVTSIRICHALLYARVAFRPVHNDAVLCSVGSCTEPQIVLVRNKGILIFHIIPDYHPENPWNVLHPSNKRFEEVRGGKRVQRLAAPPAPPAALLRGSSSPPRRRCIRSRKSCTDAGMLPGPLLPLPPPPPPELVVYPSVPSLPPSATPPSSSSSIGSSIAIVVLVVITTAIVTVAILPPWAPPVLLIVLPTPQLIPKGFVIFAISNVSDVARGSCSCRFFTEGQCCQCQVLAGNGRALFSSRRSRQRPSSGIVELCTRGSAGDGWIDGVLGYLSCCDGAAAVCAVSAGGGAGDIGAALAATFAVAAGDERQHGDLLHLQQTASPN
uniref:TATA box-binding protein-associated factor RNA polymerase I subunit B n=1 Tax=Oryza rufipogon TaxID=4529 RepID=A0A0E0PL61_ORYRU